MGYGKNNDKSGLKILPFTFWKEISAWCCFSPLPIIKMPYSQFSMIRSVISDLSFSPAQEWYWNRRRVKSCLACSGDLIFCNLPLRIQSRAHQNHFPTLWPAGTKKVKFNQKKDFAALVTRNAQRAAMGICALTFKDLPCLPKVPSLAECCWDVAARSWL